MAIALPSIREEALPTIVDRGTGEVLDPNLEFSAHVAGLSESPAWLQLMSNLGSYLPPGVRLFRRFTLAARSTMWVPMVGSGLDPLPCVDGLVVYQTPYRVYWDAPYRQGTPTPPTCHSINGHIGVGIPGGPCHSCHLSKRGSGSIPERVTVASACGRRRLLFILPPGAMLPILLDLSPTPSDSVDLHAIRMMDTYGGVGWHQSYWRVGLDKAGETARTQWELQGLMDCTDKDYIKGYLWLRDLCAQAAAEHLEGLGLPVIVESEEEEFIGL